MPMRERGPTKSGGKRGAHLLKSCYSTSIGSSNMKMVADSTDMLLQALATSFLEMSTSMT